MMNKLNANIHTIVHLGAGTDHNLQQLMVKKPARVVLVEADPQRFAKLEEAAAPYDNVELYCLAVGGGEESVKLNIFNLAEVSSICTPQGLLDIFPGLQLVEVVEVAAAPASQIISQVNLDELENNVLIVDTPGVEIQVLRDLHGTEQLQFFKYLFLNCGRVPLYEDGASGFTIVDWLKDEGFDVEEFDESHDYDRPSWLLRRNDLFLRHKELTMRFEELENQSATARIQLKEEETKTKKLTELFDKQARKIEDLALENERVESIVEEHEQTIDGKIKKEAELRAQLDENKNQIRTLTQLRAEKSNELRELKERLEQHEVKHEKLETTIKELKGQEKNLTSELEDNRQQVNSLMQQRDKQTRNIEELLHSQNKHIDEKEAIKNELASITQNHSEAGKQLEVRQAKIDRLQAERQKLQEENSKYLQKIESLTKEKEKIQKQAESEKEKALATTQQLQEEQDYRQQLIDQEVLKAEAQLELVKDILIRDKAF